MRFRFPATIRFQLTSLVIAAVLPVWLVSCLLLFHGYSSKREQIYSDMLESARSLSMVVDRELTSVEAALQGLATSPSFAAGDYAALHAQALQLLRSYPGADIIMADATGQQLVNSARPFGTELPRRNNLDTVRRIFQEGKPVISDLFYGALTKRPLVSVDIPVLVDGKVAFDLAMTFPSDRMARLLQQHHFPGDRYGAIVDSKPVVVARSRYPEKYVGNRANPKLVQALKTGSEGSTEFTNQEGKPALITYCRSAVSPWTVVVGVSRSSVMVPLYRWAGLAFAGAAVFTLLGVLLAMGYARRITRDIQGLVEPAGAIGRGEPVAILERYSAEETRAVASALLQASDLLQVHEGELARERQQLQETLEELERSNKELEQFAYVASHDLQEPLRMVSSYTQLLAQRYQGELDDKAHKYIDYAVDGAVRMQRLINDLLAYSRVSTRGRSFETVDARAALGEALHDLAAALEESGAQVVPDELPAVSADPTQLGQLFQNLIGNAIKFRGEELPRVSVSALDLGEEWRFAVKDNGIGIDPQYADKIFVIFQRLHTRREYSGTGIGLAICKRIVERHGGRIWYESQPGQGATFYFTLPK